MALVLSITFGPLGLFYASIIGGIVILVISIVVSLFTLGFGLIFTNIICAVWAVIATNNTNSKMNS